MMTADEILKYTGGGLVLLLTFIQIAPIKINPWSWLAKKIGNAFSHDVIEKLKDHDKKFESLDKEIRGVNERIGKSEADQSRQRILGFNDELLHNIDHSKEYFDNILDDITEYERYCSTHPDYKNTKAELAIENIKDVYKKLSAKGGFL